MTNNLSLEIKSDFKIVIAMDSDWHIGSGTGRRGDIDRLVKRDRNDLPYLPAKTITGIWRDACELLATGLDEGAKNGYFSQLVDYLFGDQPALAKGVIAKSPREAALSIRAAHFPEALSNALKDKPILKEAISFIKVGVSIDDHGCAIEDHLRFEEVVRGGITLTSDCHLNLPEDDELQKLCFAFLLASTKFFEKIGGKRRRGNGQCSVKVESVPINEWITWLGEYLSSNQISLPEIPKLNIQKNEPKSGKRQEGTENSWQTIRLQIEAISPIVISQRTVGNVVETLDYISGTHLLRMVRRQIVKHNSTLATSIDSAIAHNDIVVTNATIAINDHQGYPTPFILSSEKIGGGIAKGAKIYNRFVDTLPDNTQTKGERGGYLNCAITNNTLAYPSYQKVDITAATHNIVDDAEQRPNQNTGGVYTYQAIAAGTVFQAEVRLRNHIVIGIAQTRENWQKILGGETAIGQSKKDDYGRVNIEVLAVNADLATSTTANKESKNLKVWLLSDVLLRDDRLRPTTDFSYLQRELETKLDIKLTQHIEKLGIARSHRIDSWQVLWQKPRPSLVGISAGSCINFEVSAGELDLDKLAEIERSGLGERRAEGYGQVSFNHPLLSQSPPNPPESQRTNSDLDNSSDSPLISAADPLYSYARIIEYAAWQKAIQQKVLAKAEERKSLLYIGIKKDKPTMSQLGALRSVLSRLHGFDKRDEAILWLANVKANKNRKEKWLDQSLVKIEKYLTEENLIWSDLALDTKAITLTETGKIELKKELWAEALYSLVDACIREHKRESEK
jgi:CRISPR-associated protein Csx10